MPAAVLLVQEWRAVKTGVREGMLALLAAGAVGQLVMAAAVAIIMEAVAVKEAEAEAVMLIAPAAATEEEEIMVEEPREERQVGLVGLVILMGIVNYQPYTAVAEEAAARAEEG